MNNRDKDFPEKVIRTWEWPLNRGDFHIPVGADPKYFFCRSHVREDDELLPFDYEGQELYVCRICGKVYEISQDPERKEKDYLKTWHGLFEQPYDWYYMRNPDLLKSYFVHENDGITSHPLLDAHGGGNRADSLELIVRFFIHELREEYMTGIHFFNDFHKNIKVYQDDDMLILSKGNYLGSFPHDEFCVYREDANGISMEVSHSWSENIFGFTLDLNEEDYEYYESHRMIRFTYLNDADIDSIVIRQTEEGDLRIKQQIVHNPFGLEGFFLYENMELSRLSKNM